MTSYNYLVQHNLQRYFSRTSVGEAKNVPRFRDFWVLASKYRDPSNRKYRNRIYYEWKMLSSERDERRTTETAIFPVVSPLISSHSLNIKKIKEMVKWINKWRWNALLTLSLFHFPTISLSSLLDFFVFPQNFPLSFTFIFLFHFHFPPFRQFSRSFTTSSVFPSLGSLGKD